MDTSVSSTLLPPCCELPPSQGGTSHETQRLNGSNVGRKIVELPPEMHVEICKYLDSQSMMNLRLSHPVFRRNIGTLNVITKKETERQEIRKSFLLAFQIDDVGKPTTHDPITRSNDSEHLEILKNSMIKVLCDEKVTSYLRSKLTAFNQVLQENTLNDELPAKEDWYQYQPGQALRSKNLAWIYSVIFRFWFACHKVSS